MEVTLTLNMRQYYALKYQSQYPDTPIYMDALSGTNSDVHNKVVDDKITSLIGRDTWGLVPRKYVADHIRFYHPLICISDQNMHTGTGTFIFNMKSNYISVNPKNSIVWEEVYKRESTMKTYICII